MPICVVRGFLVGKLDLIFDHTTESLVKVFLCQNQCNDDSV